MNSEDAQLLFFFVELRKTGVKMFFQRVSAKLNTPLAEH